MLIYTEQCEQNVPMPNDIFWNIFVAYQVEYLCQCDSETDDDCRGGIDDRPNGVVVIPHQVVNQFPFVVRAYLLTPGLYLSLDV